MHFLVSLLSDDYYSLVEDIWQELEDKFGLKGIKNTPFPHFTWQAAEDYDLKTLKELMKDCVRDLQPFVVKTAGLGIFFYGEFPIIYINIVKDPRLFAVHRKIFTHFKNVANRMWKFYSPESWMPHISIAYSDLSRENIGSVIKYLSFKNFRWEIEIDNLSFIYQPTGSIGQLKYKFRINGQQ